MKNGLAWTLIFSFLLMGPALHAEEQATTAAPEPDNLLVVEPPPPPPRMKPGKWQASEVVTMGEMRMPSTQYDSFCLKEGEPEEKYVVPGTGGRADCSQSKPKVKDNRVSWSMTCTDPAKPSTSTGNITWQEESYDGTVVVKNGHPQLAKMGPLTARLSGKRVGDCD